MTSCTPRDVQHSDTCWSGSGQEKPTSNLIPSDILLQIYPMLSPRDFDTARHTCSQWMRGSLDEGLLKCMLKRAGWWESWQRDCQKYPLSSQTAQRESLAWRMSKRFSTECVLSGRKANVEKTGFLTTSVVDFSSLSCGPSTSELRASASPKGFENEAVSMFNVSSCGNYLLVTSGAEIYVYRLLNRKSGDEMPVFFTEDGDIDTDLVPVSRIHCPVEVVSATIDTGSTKLIVAALLHGRTGMVCELDEAPMPSADVKTTGRHTMKDFAFCSHEQFTPVATRRASQTPFSFVAASRQYFLDIGSAEDLPRSVAIGPDRRCIAFGCEKGVELHWVDEPTKRNYRKHFPMSQPSEILRFLPNKVDESMQVRLISSLAGLGASGCQCQGPAEGEAPSAFHLHLANVQPSDDSSKLSCLKTARCHHYRAIPTSDGIHILFVEPRTGLICLGSDSPIGGPKSLTRAIVCAPPFGTSRSDDHSKQEQIPTVFASGSDLSWGLRVVAAYHDRIVLYSVPVDVLNVLRRERISQGYGVMGDSDLASDMILETEAGRTHKPGYSRVENQNGDWEFLLNNASYRPTIAMWPFKIYGKEIGQVDRVVELSVQSSHGGVRVWAFSAFGEARIFDVDAYTSRSHSLDDIPCKFLSIGPDGSLTSARLVDRAEVGSTSLRKQRYSAQSSYSGEQHSASRLHSRPVGGYGSLGSQVTSTAVEARRPSLAACFVDFQIPEMGAREGRWAEEIVA